MADIINRPAHYAEGRSIEPIDVIDDWSLSPHLANVLKYISRYDRKGSPVKDLEKAQYYLARQLKVLQGGPEARRIEVGDTVRCVDSDLADALLEGYEYRVADVSRGPERTFVVLANMPARYWDVDRFEVGS
jgi:hypothetical protein